MKFAYNAVWFACFCWFVWSCFNAIATTPKGAGIGPLALTFLIGMAPMLILWLWKRWYTGKWIS